VVLKVDDRESRFEGQVRFKYLQMKLLHMKLTTPRLGNKVGDRAFTLFFTRCDVQHLLVPRISHPSLQKPDEVRAS
jgi:hypothetical protein